MRWVAAALAAAAFAGCGGEGELTVAAASSLRTAFGELGGARFSFAGSDELAAQIEQGVRPDVYAAADPALPDRLHERGLVERPVVFAVNRLVLAVPAGGRVRSLHDAARDGVTVAMGAPGVPVGASTRSALDRLDARLRDGVLANVRSNEPDAGGVVGKLTQGAVDAGFVYATDVRAAGGRLRAIELPARARPQVAYAAAVVRGTDRLAEARAFVEGLRAGRGRGALRAAGFQAPP